MLKLIAFDLDGTLTQHKTPLSKENRAVLDRLSEKYNLLMVGAGQCYRIFNQMECYPIDIIGNYGMQYCEYDAQSKGLRIIRDLNVSCDRASIEAKVTQIRKKYGFTDFVGENVEFHPSGCITFPILGTKAKQKDKLSFDPDRKKRRAIYAEICENFPEYEVFVGGSSSFDLAPKPWNKFYALEQYCKEKGYTLNEVAFVGDDYGQGGNDESVFLSPVRFICVDDYTKLKDYLDDLL